MKNRYRKHILEKLNGLLLLATITACEVVAVSIIATLVCRLKGEDVFDTVLWVGLLKITQYSLIISAICLCLGYVISVICNTYLKSNVDLPEPLETPIEADHGSDIETVMMALRDEELEYSAIFDQNGQKIVEGTLLSPRSTRLPDQDPRSERVGKEYVTYVHNHPGITEGAFSPDDIGSMFVLGEAESIIVTMHYTYTMTNPHYQDATSNKKNARSAMYYAINCNSDLRGSLIGFLQRTHFGCRWFSWYVSYKVARRFGLEFHIENLRLRRLRQSWLFRATLAMFALGLILVPCCHARETATTQPHFYRKDIATCISAAELIDDENTGYCDPGYGWHQYSTYHREFERRMSHDPADGTAVQQKNLVGAGDNHETYNRTRAAQ